MRSGITSPRRRLPMGTSSGSIDEFYDLRGLNLTMPDVRTHPGDSPWTTNSRMYARNPGESRVANRTRMGAGHLSTPVGATQDISNTATATGDLDFSTVKFVAVPFTPTTTGALTRMDQEIKRIAQATGHVIIEIYTNNAGAPGTLIAQGSVLGSLITTGYQYLTAYFMEAPTVTSGVPYWAVYYIQDNGSGSYYLNQTAVGATAMLYSVNGGTAWDTLNAGAHFKTYISLVGGVKGFAIRYPSDLTKTRIMMAQLDSLYAIDKNVGTPVSVKSGLNLSATKYRFSQWDDNTLFANGYNALQEWDGTNPPTATLNVPIANPDNVLAWQNRLFVYKNTRVVFSELGDRTTWPSVNFFYIPITTPNSPDHIAGWKIFQDNLVFFTHLTKYKVIGSNIANFTYKEAIGTKGAASQEGIVADRNFCYFISDDKQIYRWNGISDDLLSRNVESELQGIDDVSQVRLHLYRNQLRVYYTVQGEGRMLLLDIEFSVPSQGDWRWFLDTDHYVVGSADMYMDTGDPLLEFSSLVGRVYYGETQYSDLGRRLDWKYWTPYKTYGYRRRNGQSFGGAATLKRVRRFRPVIRTENADYTMSVGKDMDFADNPDMRAYVVAGNAAKFGFFKWGDGTKFGRTRQVQNLAGMSGRGRYIQYRFERSGVETPVELFGYIAMYKIGRPK